MHMEEKKEYYSGAMLMARWAEFEDAMGVPETERLKLEGWFAIFCKVWIFMGSYLVRPLTHGLAMAFKNTDTMEKLDLLI